MKAIFNQMETKGSKCSVDTKYFEIEKKELSLDNDRLLEHIICQDVMNTVMHANDHSDNVLHTNNNSFEHDNSALDMLKHENDRPSHNQDAPEFKDFFIINDLQAQLKAKNVSIEKLKEHIVNIKGKNVVDNVQNVHNLNVVTLKVYKLDLPPLSPCIKNNMAAHEDYLKHTQENAYILREIVEPARDLRPLGSDLAFDFCNENVKHSVLNVNSELICATCHECIFNAIHDICVSDYINDVHARVKSKSVKSRSAKSKKKKMWKPTGKVYTNVGYSWKPTGRTFNIVGNTCPLTRIISTKVVPPRKSISTTPVVQIVLWYLDSGSSKHMTGQCSQLINFVSNLFGTVRFGNDQIAKIMGYGDYQLGNITI
ncbi:hypothetical protein Tco_0884622 [Tanacetum coccineum]